MCTKNLKIIRWKLWGPNITSSEKYYAIPFKTKWIRLMGLVEVRTSRRIVWLLTSGSHGISQGACNLGWTPTVIHKNIYKRWHEHKVKQPNKKLLEWHQVILVDCIGDKILELGRHFFKRITKNVNLLWRFRWNIWYRKLIDITDDQIFVEEKQQPARYINWDKNQECHNSGRPENFYAAIYQRWR